MTDAGDAFWKQYSTGSIEDLDLPARQRERLRGIFFPKASPGVARTVFIATPHRGSFLAGGPLGAVLSRLISLPVDAVLLPKHLWDGVADAFDVDPLEDLPTAVDNMDPDNPFVTTLDRLPIASHVTAHSIVAIDGDENPPDGDDGVVSYTSAHLDGVESEIVVRSFHSVQDHPVAIEEVRRILHAMVEEGLPQPGE